jgi:hypothetical protein
VSRRAAVSALLAATLAGAQLTALAALAPAPAVAQGIERAGGADESGGPPRARRVPRKLLFLGVGALVGFAASSAYTLNGSDNNSSGGTCSSESCVGTVSIVGGSAIGFMIGREFDQLYALRYRGGAPLTLANVSAQLESEASDIVARDSSVAVSITSGVQLFASGRAGLRALGRRASGVRGIGALDIVPPASALAVGSPAGLYLYPPGSGPGLLARDGRVTAVASAAGRVYFAVNDRIEVAPAETDTLRVWPGVSVGGPVETLFYDDARGLLWAGVDTMLVALRPAGDSVERVASIAVGAPVRRIAAEGGGGRLALALGESGVRLLDTSDPARARELGRWTTARFVYDVAFAGGRLFAASGVEGLYVIDPTGSQLVTVGLDRELGFVTALAAVGSDVFMLDRNTDSVRRLSADFK